jgi:chorismate synthase
MSNNTLGKIFSVTTFGESHGPCIGVVIDGCPAGVKVSKELVDEELKNRSPGKNPFSSQRKEKDTCEILSGVFQGETTGNPIAILIKNQDKKSSSYQKIENVYRPSHAQFTYEKKYQNFDYRGGGRSSGRETASWVAAGAIAKAFLQHFSISTVAYVHSIGPISIQEDEKENFAFFPMKKNLSKKKCLFPHEKSSLLLKNLHRKVFNDPLFCPDKNISPKMEEYLLQIIKEKDSIGGVVAFAASLPPCLGEPVFEKFHANVAKAFMSIPGAKAFEIGQGWNAAFQKGSEHNDSFFLDGEQIRPSSNKAGGVLGGISSGEIFYGKVAFKPTSSIGKSLPTLDKNGKKCLLTYEDASRHDPCIAIRATPVVEALLSCVIADHLLLAKVAKSELGIKKGSSKKKDFPYLGMKANE